MLLADEVLFQRLEEMPNQPEHAMVWHLCHEFQHMSCCPKIGRLAIVSFKIPEIPETLEEQAGSFLMRLHPLRRHLQNVTADKAEIWLPSALSFDHSTVWHEPMPKVN